MIHNSAERRNYLTDVTGTIGYPYGKKLVKLDPDCTLYTKTNSKWFYDLNVTSTWKLLEDNAGKYLYNLVVGKNFLNKMQRDKP